ncbi:MAG TPA: 2-C-methyl-D-erythritol 4-phosphate cytidylyltransferase [Longimicrobiales bacterium]|nr:2-C-methyl-D-erythritol 4-phosphate cytidylyltransferase [Longimicrobiales bacterium]
MSVPWPRAAAVIPAGGVGRRMGGVRKQYLELGGRPVLWHAIRPFLDHPAIHWIVVALPAEDMATPPLFLPDGVTVVAGGEERGDSVRLALEAVPPAAELVLIHDAARPLVTRALVDRTLEAAAGGVGAVAAIPVPDTLKRVAGDRTIAATVARAGLWAAQTPQAFPRAMIVDAYARAAEEGVRETDDAALVERYGGRVVVVEGSPRNLKVTTPEDLRIAALLLGGVEAPR